MGDGCSWRKLSNDQATPNGSSEVLTREYMPSVDSADERQNKTSRVRYSRYTRWLGRTRYGGGCCAGTGSISAYFSVVWWGRSHSHVRIDSTAALLAVHHSAKNGGHEKDRPHTRWMAMRASETASRATIHIYFANIERQKPGVNTVAINSFSLG